MFELLLVKKYLTPRRGRLSVSLIASLSVLVITLVVWLVLLFLSVTEGIERNWLKKLTALSGPIKISPTEKYFSSYYYNVDQFSAASGYLSKAIGQKAAALLTDPYDPGSDIALPAQMPPPERDPKGELVDPVKRAYAHLAKLQKKIPGLTFQDFEMSGALLRLHLLRQNQTEPFANESESQLTQVSFLSSFATRSPQLQELLSPPSVDDLQHLFYLGLRSSADNLLPSLLTHAKIEALKPANSLWPLPLQLMPEGISFKAQYHPLYLVIPTNTEGAKGTVKRVGNTLFYTENGSEQKLPLKLPLLIDGQMEFSVKASKADATFQVEGLLQGEMLSGQLPLNGLKIARAVAKTQFESEPAITPLWPYTVKGELKLPHHFRMGTAVLLPISLKQNGVRLGDAGYFSYPAPTTSGLQDQHLPIYVGGFYDPGLFAASGKGVLVPNRITELINAAQTSYSLDKTNATGIQVYLPELSLTEDVKAEIQKAFKDLGISSYWKVQSFREYDFAKDLMQQFDSDKTLFALIAIIILVVASSNVISMLILLVSDKKQEIGILQALGASKKSIVAIFGLCGAAIGLLSTLLGLGLAVLTLRNIEILSRFLSFIQGHEAFSPLYFGPSLPKELSMDALLFVAIATPLMALLAGLVPAIKAARLKPSEILKSP